MAKIGIDATFVKPGITGGAQQMLENLLEGLSLASPLEDELTVYGAPSRPLTAAADRLRWLEPPKGRNRFVQSTRLYRLHAREHDALLFPNYFTPPNKRGAPRVVTVIHDLQYLTHPENFSRAKREWLRTSHRLTLSAADVVVTPSEQVRAEILERHGDRWARKIVAIHNPISWDRFSSGSAGEDVAGGERYILAASAQYPHKNLSTLLEAFAALRRAGGFDDVTLVLAGQWSDRLIGIAKRVDLKGEAARLGVAGAVRFTGYIDDAELGDLYRGATIFAFPSLFEGFGMPAVEALGFGLPVLTTRNTAIPETTLGLATYLEDPLDAAEMARRMAEMLAAPEAFRPSPADVDRVRETYALGRIGKQYRDALVG